MAARIPWEMVGLSWMAEEIPEEMVRKHSPRRCRLGGPKGPLSTFQREVGPRGVFEAFERSKKAFLEKMSTDADIISLDLFESELGFSESSIQDLSRDVFSPKKKCLRNLCSPRTF